ncbi:hypothetical protein KIPB_009650 [Kipferlia bialata]|uniref:Kelch-type beta propeller n=1 Tax=Kipferlia bialata TaxID=797122 RepID=A0A9K3GLQ3_9EUKA|nr:hypothetical protein KIPB_009650 [Kipferlia bialata]|eukprot:g9650.t1
MSLSAVLPCVMYTFNDDGTHTETVFKSPFTEPIPVYRDPLSYTTCSVNGEVWLLGPSPYNQRHSELFVLSLDTLEWTQIDTVKQNGQVWPPRVSYPVSRVFRQKWYVYDLLDEKDLPSILDTETREWSKQDSSNKELPLSYDMLDGVISTASEGGKSMVLIGSEVLTELYTCTETRLERVCDVPFDIHSAYECSSAISLSQNNTLTLVWLGDAITGVGTDEGGTEEEYSDSDYTSADDTDDLEVNDRTLPVHVSCLDILSGELVRDSTILECGAEAAPGMCMISPTTVLIYGCRDGEALLMEVTEDIGYRE